MIGGDLENIRRDNASYPLSPGNLAGRRRCLLLPGSAELDDQPDYLGRNPEGQLHTSFRIVPTTLRDHHPNPSTYLPEMFPPGRPGDPT
jgi:hypothetical protein